jgi:hypothetical protein
MIFSVGDIPFYKEYTFTDNRETKPHFGLVLLPEKATKYQESNLCSVITSKCPLKWGYELKKEKYPFFNLDSFICLDRKDLVSKSCLSDGDQPRGKLKREDLKSVFKLLKKSLFCIKDIASNPYIRGTIIKEWKEKISSTAIF